MESKVRGASEGIVLNFQLLVFQDLCVAGILNDKC